MRALARQSAGERVRGTDGDSPEVASRNRSERDPIPVAGRTMSERDALVQEGWTQVAALINET